MCSGGCQLPLHMMFMNYMSMEGCQQSCGVSKILVQPDLFRSGGVRPLYLFAPIEQAFLSTQQEMVNSPKSIEGSPPRKRLLDHLVTSP